MGRRGYTGDGGQATSAQLDDPNGVFVDTSGNIFIADTENHVIRKVDTSGVITTVAGNGDGWYSGDGGQATEAELWFTQSIFVFETGDPPPSPPSLEKVTEIY